jgi:hypothetical protein
LYNATAVELTIKLVHAQCSLIFSSELDVHISDHVITNVVRHHQVFDLTILGKLHEDFLVEVLEVLHSSNSVFFRHVTPVGKRDCRAWVFVNVAETQSLRSGWFVVDSCARVAMPACTDFKVERTIYPKYVS